MPAIPVVNVRVTLYDGSYHDVDSNEMAFKIASKEAFKKGILQGNPILLEPMMNLQSPCPTTYRRRDERPQRQARPRQRHESGPNGSTTIEAVVPAAEIQRYATDLRSITQGAVRSPPSSRTIRLYRRKSPIKCELLPNRLKRATREGPERRP